MISKITFKWIPNDYLVHSIDLQKPPQSSQRIEEEPSTILENEKAIYSGIELWTLIFFNIPPPTYDLKCKYLLTCNADYVMSQKKDKKKIKTGAKINPRYINI